MMSRYVVACLTSLAFFASVAVQAGSPDSAEVLEKICVNDTEREASFRSAHPSLDRLYQDVCNKKALIRGVYLYQENQQTSKKSPSAVRVASNAETTPPKPAADTLASKLQNFFKTSKDEKKVEKSSDNESISNEPLEATEKKSIPEPIRQKVESLAEDQKPLFYGAYKAGFAHVTDIQSDVILIRMKSAPRDEVRAFDLLGSFNKSRQLDGGSRYFSFVSEIEYQCGKNLQRTLVQEYKSGVFGSGQTLKTYRLTQQDKPFRQLKNQQLIAFIENVVCEQK
jgi:hypothetical protein